MHTTVAVVGGGYGGTAVAKELDSSTDVVLIEARDTFVHNVAALRAVVDPQWIDRLFLPYDRLLDNGRVLRGAAVRVDANSVTLADGTHVTADYIVLATGSAYPFPAKMDVDDSAAARRKLRATQHALAGADSVLLLGAGAVGLELAGEIKAAWSEKAVTIVDPGPDILPGAYPGELRVELRRQLDALGVELLLGAGLREDPPSAPGEGRTFTATMRSGERRTVDIWFRCFGVSPATDYLAGDLATARRADGHLEVTDELRLPGQRNVFALGDITAIPEPKQAAAAASHAAVITANIRTLLDGGDTLDVYRPTPLGIILPLGPKGGASFAPGWENYLDTESVTQIRQRAEGESEALLRLDILDAETTSYLKGTDLMVADSAEFLGRG
jgi:NADH dehydrogenase FAD-containing subunit